jgi:hypothetical protein
MDDEPKKNIKSLEHADFDWTDGKRATSLKTLYDSILKKIDDSIYWYESKRVLKRQLAWCFRVTAIVLGAIATALPTAAEMTRTTDGWLFRPGTATILGIFIGALLMLDKFIGASSSWIRFTTADTALKELRDEFNLAWTLENATWAGTPEPSVDQTKHAVSTLQGFLTRANQIVHDETTQWKTEFQGALQQIDDSAKTRAAKVEEAVAIVKITNPDRLAEPWNLSIDGGSPETIPGDSKAIRHTPGPITLRITAKIKSGPDGKETRPFATDALDILAAGAPKTISIPLPLN